MPAGRPPMFETPEDLQIKVDEYFEYVKGEHVSDIIDGEKYEGDGWAREPEKVTITGLVLYLGFCDRSSFYNYADNKEFSYTIKKAHSRIENHYENLIQGNNVAGPIFALKNLQWKDKTEQDINLQVEKQILKDLT